MARKRYQTWGDVYHAAVHRGDDPAYAAYLADEWEKRQQKGGQILGQVKESQGEGDKPS